ncbi:MAG TPA: cell envelope integrity protein TolA [Deltaproteobacteria bacterium]|nr:cell envelope integrity protein TolA [Deltaproteobacteria bacterium]
MSAGAIDWYDESLADHRRRLRNGILFSLAVHAALLATFVIAPVRPLAPMPEVLEVELIAAPPGAPAARRPVPRPAEAEASPPPAEAPAPPSPPVAKAPVQVLPEETPGRIRKAPPENGKKKAEIVAKAEPPRPRRRKEEKPLSYEAAMAAFEKELGPDEALDLLQPAPEAHEPDASSGLPEPAETNRPGDAIPPELAAWNRAVQRRIRNNWVIPAGFRNRGLATQLELRLAASGDLIGEPRVVRSSGDPFFDDNAVRAVMKVAPLPAPPEPGRQIFIFRSEAE